MIAEALGFLAFAGGVGALLYLAGRHARGRPVLSPHPSPFADADPTRVFKPRMALIDRQVFSAFQPLL